MSTDEKNYTAVVTQDPEKNQNDDSTVIGSVSEIAHDDSEMQKMGYKSVFVRELTSFSNFGISFGIISIPTGIPQLWSYGLTNGGPSVMVWGVVIVGFFTQFISFCMAEICSSYPTSGGVYYWAFQLAPPGYGPYFAWLTAYMNILGQIALIASVDFGLALFFEAFLILVSDYTPDPSNQRAVGFFFMFVTIHMIMNMFPTSVLRWFDNFSVMINIITVFVVVITVLSCNQSRVDGDWASAASIFSNMTKTEVAGLNSASWVSTTFVNGSGGFSNSYTTLCGLLFGAFVFTGYEASAAVSEETKNADVAAPVGMFMSTLVSYPVCILFVVALLYALPKDNYDDIVSGGIPGDPFTETLWVATGSKKGAIALIWLIISTNFMCGFASVQGAARVIYAFARDDGLLGSKYLLALTPWKIPYAAIIGACFVSFILALPYLKQPAVFYAMTSLAVIGLNISYVIPIALRVYQGKKFIKSTFNLGPFGEIMGVIAVLYVAFLVVIMTFPPAYPVVALNMNYACLLAGSVVVFSSFAWIVSARHWFKGPPISRGTTDASIATTAAAAVAEALEVSAAQENPQEAL